MVFPVILGSGKRLFPTDAEDKQKVTLRESRTYTNGVQLNIFDTALSASSAQLGSGTSSNASGVCTMCARPSGQASANTLPTTSFTGT